MERFSFRPDRPPSDGDEPPKTGIERRRHERVLVHIEVDYRANETFLFAYITDISAMGIFVRTDHPSPPGTRLGLRFSPPAETTLTGQLIECEGEVIWINPFLLDAPDDHQPGMGVQFRDLDDGTRDAIFRLVHTFAYLDDDGEDDFSRS